MHDSTINDELLTSTKGGDSNKVEKGGSQLRTFRLETPSEVWAR
jgi:hypothetical protein